MSELGFWLRIAFVLLAIGWMIYWGVQSVRRPREVMRDHWWPLADDEPTWPIVAPGVLLVGFALLALAFLLYAVVNHIR